MYVRMMKEETQKAIEAALILALQKEGLQGEELLQAVKDGMDSKLYDLTDTIDISPYEK